MRLYLCLLIVSMFIMSVYCVGMVSELKEKAELILKASVSANCAAITVLGVAYNIVCVIIILRIL